MKRTLIIGVSFALLTFLVAVALSVWKISVHRQIDVERVQAFGIIQRIDGLMSSVIDVENAWSSYTANRSPSKLEAYHSALNETIKRKAELHELYADRRDAGRIADLELLIDSRLQVFTDLLEAESPEAGLGTETEVQVLRREEAIHNALIQTAQDLEQAESAEIAKLDRAMDKLSQQSVSYLLAGTLVSIITFLGLFAVLFRELRERKRLEQVIKRQAHSDTLTGLPNRLAFMERMDYELRRAHRSRSRLAALFLDLDRFKDINDNWGHEAGDELLRQVSARLKGDIRESDSLARIGGDEFNILVTNISDTADVSLIVEKVLGSFELPFVIAGQELPVGSSIGISIYPEDGVTAADLLKHADIAMYHAKRRGGNNYQFYNQSLNRQIVRRAMLEKTLRHALGKNELVLHYQPRVDVKTRRIVCLEALVRWQHPEMGLLDPIDFIPLAEGTGIITSLDEWVLRKGCTDVKEWENGCPPEIGLSVNVSQRDFKRPDLARTVSGILREIGFDPHRLELELSEQSAMEDIANTAEKLEELARLGIGLGIDHFGAGHSSLSDLKILTVHRIKIDRSFIKGIAASRNDRAIIKAMIVMAHNMGVRVVAEGVERAEQMSFLEANDCDEVQGYHLSPPIPLDECKRFAAAYQAGK